MSKLVSASTDVDNVDNLSTYPLRLPNFFRRFKKIRKVLISPLASLYRLSIYIYNHTCIPHQSEKQRACGRFVHICPHQNRLTPKTQQHAKKGQLMTRSRSSARSAGTRTERVVADYLATALNDDRIDRRVKRGTKDRGDIGGLRIHGQRLVAEVKDCARLDLPSWTAEANLEAGNDDALLGIVIAKRRGTSDPGKFWVHMTVDDLLALLSGERQGHRKETLT